MVFNLKKPFTICSRANLVELIFLSFLWIYLPLLYFWRITLLGRVFLSGRLFFLQYRKSCIPLQDSFFFFFLVRYFFFLSSVGAHLYVIFPLQLWKFSSLLFPFESVVLRCFRVDSADLSLTVDISPFCHWISVSFSMFETFLVLCTWANWAFAVEIIPSPTWLFTFLCVFSNTFWRFYF